MTSGEIVEAYIRQLDEAHIFQRKIVTQVVPLKRLLYAEAYHQHFLENNPTYPISFITIIPRFPRSKSGPKMCKR